MTLAPIDPKPQRRIRRWGEWFLFYVLLLLAFFMIGFLAAIFLGFVPVEGEILGMRNV